MSSSVELHPAGNRLLQFAAGELPEADAFAVRRHVEGCAQCSQDLAAIEAALSDLQTAHEFDKRHAPPPPEPWFDLRERLQQLDAGPSVLSRRKPLFFVTRRWAAAAAGVAVALLLYRTVVETPVSAAELLREASRREQNATMPRRDIRIRSSAGGKTILRPARVEALSAAGPSDLPSRFAAANFSWEEPLSARAFARWRSGLRQKQDRVRVVNRMYEVTTSTDESLLASASITLRAEDMKAVTETLRFRDGLELQISEAVPTAIEPPPAMPAGDPQPLQTAEAPAAPPAVTAGDELRVLAALHAIGADLGEPVEVARDEDSVSVKVLGGSVRRREQIRDAVGDLPHAEISFEDPQPVRAGARPSTSESASIQSAGGPLVEQLRSVLPAGADVAAYTDDILLASEGATARAFAIRNLADRFPPETERGLSPADRQTLHQLVAGHAGALRRQLDEMDRLLKPLPRSGGFIGSLAHGATWQAHANLILGSAQQLDQAVNQALAVPGAAVGSGKIDALLYPLTRQVEQLSELLTRSQ
jgi:hypothetical protein